MHKVKNLQDDSSIRVCRDRCLLILSSPLGIVALLAAPVDNRMGVGGAWLMRAVVSSMPIAEHWRRHLPPSVLVNASLISCITNGYIGYAARFLLIQSCSSSFMLAHEVWSIF